MRLVLNGWRLNVRQDDEIEVRFDGPFIDIQQWRVGSDGGLLLFKTYTLSAEERARTVEGQMIAKTALEVK